jgi:hypothetical protein
MIFRNISADQVNSVHELFLFLRKLKIIGTVETHTERTPLSEEGRLCIYTLSFKSYDHSTRNKVSPMEKLEAYFRASEKLASLCNESLE